MQTTISFLLSKNKKTFKHQIDTIELCKKSKKYSKLNEPTYHKLSTTCKCCEEKDVVNAHAAYADAQATVDILMHTHFWNIRANHFKGINKVRINQIIADNNDSDTDSDSDKEDA